MTNSATQFTLLDMLRFATEAWGPHGGSAVECWARLNGRYFGGRLQPIPLVLTNAQPYGRRIAFCSFGGLGRTITLNVPKNHRWLLADNSALLHEMVHQALFEAGEDAGHDSIGWRREIMRLTQEIAGLHVWAGRSVTRRFRNRDGKGSYVARINEPRPDCGEPSLTQGAIARWPHSVGICLGELGTQLSVAAGLPATPATTSSPHIPRPG